MALGEVTEWLKVLAWKAGVPQKGTEGSNPSLSARVCTYKAASPRCFVSAYGFGLKPCFPPESGYIKTPLKGPVLERFKPTQSADIHNNIRPFVLFVISEKIRYL